MARKKRGSSNSGQSGSPEWMTTYSDLVTLLMCFFILLFSMSKIDSKEFQLIATSLQARFPNMAAGDRFNTNKGADIIKLTPQDNPVPSQQNKEVNNSTSKDQKQSESEKKLEDFKNKLEKTIIEIDQSKHVKIVSEKNSIILRIDSLILFDSGKAELKPDGKVVLKELSAVFNDLENDILIHGHTDNLPINTTLFPSNWELSTKRAVNIVLFLSNSHSISSSRMTASGHGEFKPIESNDTSEGRKKTEE